MTVFEDTSFSISGTAVRHGVRSGLRLMAVAGTVATAVAGHAFADPPADTPLQIPAVDVQDQGAAPPEGSAASGYRAETASLGPLGKVSLKDTPYSVNVVTQDLMENLQATSTSDALRYSPSARPQLGSNFSSNYFMIRGFTSSPFGATSSAAVDGMRDSVLFEPVEDKERIEVMDGPASFLYGFAAPGGTVDYVLKRPTRTRLNRITVGDYGDEQGYVHGDFGGPIDEAGRFGYRVNLVKVAGGTVGVDGETHKRELFSGAFDWRIAPDTLWSVDVSHFDRDLRGQQGIFLVGSATSIPSAPDLSKNYGAPYSFTHDEYDRVGTNIKSKLSDMFTVRAAFRYSDNRNSAVGVRDTLTDNVGGYNYYQLQVKGTNGYDTTQGNSFVDASFDTLGVHHDATVGVAIDHVIGLTAYPDPTNGSNTYTFAPLVPGNMANPNAPAQPNYAINLGDEMHQTGKTDLRTLIVADRITLNDQWSLLGGFNLPRMESRSFNTNSGAMTAQYAAERITPAGAILFKPIPAVTTYVSYVEALQQGAVVGAGYANSGQVLQPYLSTQYEVGAKATLGRMDLNLALFRISKANTYIDSATNTETMDGEEVHKGAEFSFTGKASDALTLGGGLTLLNTKITKTSTAGLTGKTPLGVPEAIATLFGEYAVPHLDGLSVMAGASYTGKEWVDNANTLSIPDVFLMDAGIRYAAELYGTPTTFRLNVDNLLDNRYWTNKGDNMLYPGNPRTVAFSVSADF